MCLLRATSGCALLNGMLLFDSLTTRGQWEQQQTFRSVQEDTCRRSLPQGGATSQTSVARGSAEVTPSGSHQLVLLFGHSHTLLLCFPLWMGGASGWEAPCRRSGKPARRGRWSPHWHPCASTPAPPSSRALPPWRSVRSSSSSSTAPSACSRRKWVLSSTATGGAISAGVTHGSLVSYRWSVWRCCWGMPGWAGRHRTISFTATRGKRNDHRSCSPLASKPN